LIQQLLAVHQDQRVGISLSYKFGSDHCLRPRLGQLLGARGKHVQLCPADDEPKILEEPADLVLNISLDLDEQSSADKKGLDRMTVETFDADLFVPTTLHDANDAYSVVTVTLVDLYLQRRLRMSGIDADDGQPHFIQLGPQPRRRCSRLESDPCGMRRMQPDERRDPRWDRTAHFFDISPLRKDRLVRGIDDIDVTLQYRDAIESFEARRRAAIPWLPTARRD
jgi:hypothetical protein